MKTVKSSKFRNESATVWDTAQSTYNEDYTNKFPQYANESEKNDADDMYGEYELKPLRPYYPSQPPYVIVVKEDKFHSKLPCYVNPNLKISPWLPDFKYIATPVPIETKPYFPKLVDQFGEVELCDSVRFLKPYYKNNVYKSSKCEKLPRST